MLVCFCFVFLILFNACKYFKRPLGNQLPKCVEGLPFLNKSHREMIFKITYFHNLQITADRDKNLAVHREVRGTSQNSFHYPADLFNNTSWSTVSKAAPRSNRTSSVTL